MNHIALSDEDQIRASIDNWVQAVRTKDLDRLMRDYAPEVLVCDMVPPLRYTGPARYRELCEEWFGGWEGAIDCEVRVERLLVSGDLGLAVCLTHNSGTRQGGEKLDMWLRVTVGFQKREGAWKVIHEHVSVPIDMETDRPCFDLQP